MTASQIERMRWAAAKLLLNPGLSERAAQGFLRALIEEARRVARSKERASLRTPYAGDASFGDLSALADLAELLFVAAQLDLEGAQ